MSSPLRDNAVEECQRRIQHFEPLPGAFVHDAMAGAVEFDDPAIRHGLAVRLSRFGLNDPIVAGDNRQNRRIDAGEMLSRGDAFAEVRRQNEEWRGAPAPIPEPEPEPLLEPEPEPEPEPEQEQEQSPPPAETSSTGMWAVQLGSFGDQDNANKLAADLRKQNFSAFLSKVSTGSGELHRVRIGPLKDRESAEATAARLAESGHKGQVVPHP